MGGGRRGDTEKGISGTLDETLLHDIQRSIGNTAQLDTVNSTERSEASVVAVHSTKKHTSSLSLFVQVAVSCQRQCLPSHCDSASLIVSVIGLCHREFVISLYTVTLPECLSSLHDCHRVVVMAQ